jgi:methionyl-tRNA formyltransferase
VRILLLSPYPERLAAIFAAAGDSVSVLTDPIDAAVLEREKPDFVVSYGYRHIIRRPVLEALPGRVINLHAAYLPFNRGADPNLWSWVDDTPKGVTIHLVDEGIDTGAVLAQRKTAFPPGQTLASSYARLQDDMVALFADSWPAIRAGRIEAVAQEGTGTIHRSRDKEGLFELLPAGWDTPVEEAARIIRAARRP